MKTNNENMNYYARNNMFVLNSIFTGFNVTSFIIATAVVEIYKQICSSITI
jgi:hypothetical protein